MRKTILLFPFLFYVFSGCDYFNKPSEKVVDTVRVFPGIDILSTAYNYQFTQQLPKGFYFDTLSFFDSTLKSQYTIHVLQNKEMMHFNNSIIDAYTKMIEINKSYFNPFEIEADSFFYYSYTLGPHEFYKDDNIISICCVRDDYTYGGNHHNYSLSTFNYDIKNKKVILFKDVFKLKNQKDSIHFIRMCERNVLGGSELACSRWFDRYDSLDFSFNKLGIIINPQLDWACGMQRSLLLYDSLEPFIANKWMKDY